MRALGRIALATAMLGIAVMPGVARADATPWNIGAAKVDTTPPLFDPAQDLVDFPEVDPARAMTCPRATYNGPRLWRFEEPYQDTDGSGNFSYFAQGTKNKPLRTTIPLEWTQAEPPARKDLGRFLGLTACQCANPQP